MRSTPLTVLVFLLTVLVVEAADTRRVPPERSDLPELPRFARIVDVKAILDEVALPPLPFSAGQPSVPQFPLLAERLKHYGPDGTIEDLLKDREKYPLRVAVLHAIGVARKVPMPGDAKGALSLAQIDNPPGEKAKKAVSKIQDYVAVAAAELELELATLAELEKLRADEPRRWQAHYDYTVAQLRRRLVVVYEYNKALGDIRTESLPALPDGSTGWRLAPAESLRSRKEVQLILQNSTEGFKAIVTEFKGTPWEALARNALLAQPGLRWEPIVK